MARVVSKLLAEQGASAALRPCVLDIDTVVGWRQFSIHLSCLGVTQTWLKLFLSMNSKGLPCLLEIVC